MIRVTPAPEPPQFDEQVRQPGLALIARLAAGAGSENAIQPHQLRDYWLRALDDLLAGYNHTCAYLSVRISRATGRQALITWSPSRRLWIWSTSGATTAWRVGA